MAAFPVSVELGRVAQGATREAVVHLVNKGTLPLHVAGLSTSCGCTTSSIETSVLLPGKPVALHISFNSMGFSGHEEKIVSVNFADGRPALDIPVRCDIYPFLTVSPASADLGNIALGATQRKTLTLTRVDGGLLPLPRFSGITELTVKETRRATNSVTLSLEMRPKEYSGQRLSFLMLQTGLSALPQIILPVRSNVTGQYLVTPRQVDFGLVSEEAKKQVVISDSRRGPLGKLYICSLPPHCFASLTKDAEKETLLVRCVAKGFKGIINAPVVLATGNAHEATIKVPVLALVK